MAGRIKIYQVVRKIHLYTAFTLIGFVGMYFITGFILAHGQWFTPATSTVITHPYKLTISATMSAADLSVYLQDTFSIQAKRLEPTIKNDTTVFEYIKPGRYYQIKVPMDRTTALLRIEKHNLVRTLIGFHRMHGYGGGWLYNVYVVMMDLASIATILFSLTGIYLWYKLIRQKSWGLLLLAVSISYTMLVIYLFMNR